MGNLKLKNVEQIPYCPRGKFNVPLDDCKKCIFYDGIENRSVKCIKDGLIDFNSITVTRFIADDKEYEYRDYNKEVDGEIDSVDPYDYCQKCDMNKELPNGRQYCVLRNDIPTDVIYPFICEEGKIWKEVVKK